MKKLTNPRGSYNSFRTPTQSVRLSCFDMNQESPNAIFKKDVDKRRNLRDFSTKVQNGKSSFLSMKKKLLHLNTDKKPVSQTLKEEHIDYILNSCSKLEDPKLSKRIKRSINTCKEISEGVHGWASSIVEGLKTTQSQAELTRLMNYKKTSKNIDLKIMNESKAQARKELISMTKRVIQFKKSMFMKRKNTQNFLSKSKIS